MTYYDSNWPMNCNTSGRLGEEFCKIHFNASEPHFEIKSAARKSGIVVVKTWQLLNDLHKQFIICVYDRKARRLTKGYRKGKEVYTESIKKAYEKRIHVHVIQGFDLLEIVAQEKLPTYLVRSQREAFAWKAYYRVPIRRLPNDVIKETKYYTLHGEELDYTPNFDDESEYRDEVPF